MRASVVIPTYNRLADLRRTLAALARQSAEDFEVIVVDNSSTDGTKEAMDALAASGELPFPLACLRKSPEGPAAARNLGAREARASLVVFVDSDAELREDWLATALAEFARDPDLGALGGRVIYANDRARLNSFGGCLSRIGLAWDALEGDPLAAASAPRERLWINCTAVMMRREAVLEVGGFDERFFYAFEDSDLGWRLALAGWRQKVLPALETLHHVGEEIGRASDGIVFHASKNRLASLIANSGPRGLLLHLPIHLAYAAVDAALRPPRAAKLRGVLWNLTHLRGTMRRRREIMRLRRRGEAELAPLFADTLFPKVRLAGMRRRPNRAQSVSEAAAGDDRV
jgi:GT2 family glycosyltransferase